MLGQSAAGNTKLPMPGRVVTPRSPMTSMSLGRTSPEVLSAKASTKMPVGNVFRRIRAGTRLSQRAFAQRFGIPLQTVRNLEQGRRNDGSRAVRFQYACVLADPEQACLLAAAAEALRQSAPDPSHKGPGDARDRQC